MGLGEFNAEPAFDDGDIETFTVVGDKYLVIPYVSFKIIQVVAIDIAADTVTLIEGDGGDLCLRSQTGGFDVEVGSLFPEMGKESPLLICSEAAAEKGRPQFQFL